MKKVVSILLLMALIVACDNPEPYDQERQLIEDINLIDAILARNGVTAEEDITGIRYRILELGNGEEAKAAQVVAVNYTLYRLTGEIIDTSVEQNARDAGIYDPEREYGPFPFQIGSGRVIPGFEISTQLLTEGGSGDFWIPSVFCYRNIGSGNIGPNESLYFQIELVDVNVQPD